MRCQSCEVLRINGTPVHEIGCRESWVNPSTGDGYPVPCWECGCDFTPDSRPSRYSICPDCANPEPMED